MKETGLMFKAPLVRAILSGQKTQTRRLLKPQPDPCTHDAWPTTWVAEGCEWHCSVCGIGNRLNPRVKEGVSGINCPMGKPGDRIYVREAHAHHPQFPQMAFRADGEEFEDADGWRWEPKWTPAIHMKKEEARIWLEITGVRVERLQQITSQDCIAEGLRTNLREHDAEVHLQKQFQELWDTTDGNWDANPWVWVIDFKTISTTGRPA